MSRDKDCRFNDCRLCANYEHCTNFNFKQDDLKKLDERLSRDVSYFCNFSIFAFLFSILSLILSIVSLVLQSHG